MEKKLRKIRINIEETGDYDGQGFAVYMDGDTDRIAAISESDMSPAELWGSRFMQACIDLLQLNDSILDKSERSEKGEIH